ncbi:osteopetrosis-associated transmembrane protein 1 [Epargyreus clarus]|uniref:osteopetrosis-associated transmembrane protein 1 n=1 Tax=Epargyreus clarus TaxID=520877 RepID=UPI003C2D4164
MKILLIFLIIFITVLRADIYKDNKWLPSLSVFFQDGQHVYPNPAICDKLLDDFAKSASGLTLCSINNSRPITLCERCIDEYVAFSAKYQELKTTVVNGTSCGSVFMSRDRLNVVMEYHDSIAALWNKGNCNGCFDWNGTIPTLKNDTINFKRMYNSTMYCILNNIDPDDKRHVCEKCFDTYVELDTFYMTLSSDSIGVDSVCMDIVDSMNATRSIWSKTLNCCNLRRTPEVAFLCFASIISLLPFIYYLAVRFYGPIRDIPNVLKQSRLKQSFLRSSDTSND